MTLTTPEYQRKLGERLRAIRNQQGLTLQQVEERSRGRWKAVVVGSYERGDRAVSVAKLAELAEFYNVPIANLLPAGPDHAPRRPAGGGDAPRVVLDLTRLDGDEDEVTSMLRRYVTRIQVERGDYNGRVLTLRKNDMVAMSVIFGLDEAELAVRLAERDLLLQT